MGFFTSSPVTAISPPYAFPGINSQWGNALGGMLYGSNGQFAGMSPYNVNDPAVQAAIAGLNANPSLQLQQARNAYSPYTSGSSYLESYIRNRAGNWNPQVANMGSAVQQWGGFGAPANYMSNMAQYGAAGQAGNYAANMAQYGASSPGAGNYMANRAGGGQTAALGYLTPFMQMVGRGQYQVPTIQPQIRYRNDGGGFRPIVGG